MSALATLGVVVIVAGYIAAAEAAKAWFYREAGLRIRTTQFPKPNNSNATVRRQILSLTRENFEKYEFLNPNNRAKSDT
jgi:hypothetical protein